MLAALVLASLLSPAMDYPTPKEAGFHHCALIYRNERRTVDNMKPYAAQWQDGKARRWLFDAFLFLVYTTSRGRRTEVDPTQRVDWDEQLDGWFKEGRDLDSLDKAMEEASKQLGDPPRKRQIILSIPYPHPSVTDFGDVNGDGRSEDLSQETGRRAVLSWYLAEAERRFRQAGYRHLELWGFYWMNEATGSEDAEKIQLASRLVHDKGYRLLWIPWHRAPRWEQWKSFGFDVALMQPNYAFVSSQHKGAVKRNRLAVNAELARTNGLGVEIETGNVAVSDVDRRAFYHYLSDGAKSRYGYQDAATAYYLANDNVERCASSEDPEVRRVYDLLCDYVSGREVPDQDPRVEWDTAQPFPIDLSRPVQIEGRLERPATLKAIEVYIEESGPASVWQGSVRAETRDDSGTWRPAGWAIKASRDAQSGTRQVVTIPIERPAAQIRLSFIPAPGSTGRLERICLDGTHLEPIDRHLAFKKRYKIDPPAGSSAYGDTGGYLTDGIVPKLGFLERRSVGWQNESATIAFDLRRERPVSSIEVVCEYSPGAAVYWPSSALAFLSREPLPERLAFGLGEIPSGLVWVAPSKPITERTRPDGSLDGRLVFAPEKPTNARYATLVLKANAWLMVSEVRVISQGKNVAPESAYTLSPAPTATSNAANPYPDDGSKLVDGKIAQGFESGMLVGWQDGKPRSFIVDLGSETRVSEVSVWSLRGGRHAIYAPERVSVEVSKDGSHWFGKKTVEKDKSPEDGQSCKACAFTAPLSSPTEVRFIRVEVSAGKGWAMLSEIVVR